MPRKKHEWYPDAKLHVIARGNHRNDIFKDNSDYELYLSYLQEAIVASSVILPSQRGQTPGRKWK